jgi:DNA-binding response OmpR family regulator
MMAKILLVDDDAEFRENLNEILSDAGYEVEMAPTGREALKVCGTNEFDVILLDLIMPETPGNVILSEFRKLSPASSIIMITAFATIENAVEAMKRGASDFITKPFKVSELLIVIRRALEEAKFRRNKKELDMDYVLNSLANSIRRNILWALREHSRMRLMEITRYLGVEDHTRVVFHLRNLKEVGLIDQDGEKAYFLSQEGNNVMGCLGILHAHLSAKRT